MRQDRITGAAKRKPRTRIARASLEVCRPASHTGRQEFAHAQSNTGLPFDLHLVGTVYLAVA